ncbi:hypothetical protein N5P37_011964 [Trichoderma harzianum]|uniref:Uncharacterized protein n=1 Tax=Trichoderma harzianum CBS 226.95 TaxID=983964 RepID=A0A2T3ZRS7_TRIHA|nr:hypothetical protein M431DRAFT_102102 [Trichoderma harzianum CBS 226.95]KAK0755456.1 hypothetical protein N5P37_011964 [Trichoderma harzianum]PKK43731.1 hypothetical protein CI102_12955 [Trichoderma harzianum]PTB47517.1 hypothetical protein M431DRAFT_102102 [Trichoderma harzianum CBS 226.95]
MKSILAILTLAVGLALADTLTIDLHANGCDDTPFQSFTIGNIGECHPARQAFNSFVQRNIAQSFFGRNLGIRAFRNNDCTGPSSTDSLSNTRQCVGNEGASFMLTTRD